MKMPKYISVTEANHVSGFKLRLRFNNGYERVWTAFERPSSCEPCARPVGSTCVRTITCSCRIIL